MNADKHGYFKKENHLLAADKRGYFKNKFEVVSRLAPLWFICVYLRLSAAQISFNACIKISSSAPLPAHHLARVGNAAGQRGSRYGRRRADPDFGFRIAEPAFEIAV